ncbi:MAG TPA: serine hydrolase domain-containing protein [Pyrinomonadaceae bacterium]|nr:serine hydrolase domain-containing protein [Pyrinomonadaceae bacterium]
MPRVVSRRKLLRGSAKAALGAIVLKDLDFDAWALSSTSQTVAPQSPRLRAAFDRLDEFVARHLVETGAPGMTLAIADRNGPLRTAHYGFADLKVGAKVGPQTLFEIGSISKSFVAIAAVDLAEEGKLDLQKPVIDYLPWLKVETSFPPFTAHHLLSHTSGLSSVPLLIRVAVTPLRVGFEPGTRFLYSNIGYVLLGFLLESLDERPLGEILQRRVLDMLGMKATNAIITNATRERLAVGYAPFYDDRPFPRRGKLAEAPWIEVPESAGSIASPASDMVNYLHMLLNRGATRQGRIMSEKSFALFTAPVIKAPFRGEEASYAYGLWSSDIDGHTLLRHTGGMIAFSSALFADVTAGLAVFASVNARLWGGYRPVAVTRYALDLLSAVQRKSELLPPPKPLPAPDLIPNAADYTGTFTSPEGKKLVLVADGERLLLQHNGNRIVLEQAGKDRFIVKHPDFELFMLGFGREKDLVVEAFHGFNWWPNERYTGPKTFTYPKAWNAYAGHYRSDSPWYGSTRVVIRKGQLLLEGDQPLTEINSGLFQPEGEDIERIAFDTIVDGHAFHVNYSGIDFYRTTTP